MLRLFRHGSHCSRARYARSCIVRVNHDSVLPETGDNRVTKPGIDDSIETVECRLLNMCTGSVEVIQVKLVFVVVTVIAWFVVVC